MGCFTAKITQEGRGGQRTIEFRSTQNVVSRYGSPRPRIISDLQHYGSHTRGTDETQLRYVVDALYVYDRGTVGKPEPSWGPSAFVTGAHIAKVLLRHGSFNFWGSQKFVIPNEL